MYLKKIETQGFKSFANRMVLEFQPGIMGIVGPNGSGKSNVADAIRWVLGEQSAKQLRGSNMQDVIFAGTENRKPQGYAFVELTIDNRDHLLDVEFEDVTISRRVFRSGESEYRMNGHICRLRDVLELFYDTGVGKEGYSIIGQGQIDRILSGKPEERRELFDEAAGIVKYKKRRNLTQKKLETEEGNLVRVTDILRELEKQVGPLEKQAEKARQYLKLKEELKSADVQAFRLEMGDLSRKWEDNHQRLEIVQADAEKTRTEAEEWKVRYESLGQELQELDDVLSEDQRNLAERSVRRENLEGQILVLKEQIRTAHMNKEKLHQRREELEEQKDAKKAELAGLEEERQELLSSQEIQRKEMAQREARLEEMTQQIRRKEERTVQLQNQRMEALSRKAELGAGMERSAAVLEQAQSRCRELVRRLENTLNEQEQRSRKMDELKSMLAENEKERREGKEQDREAAERQLQLEKESKKQAEDMNTGQQQYHALKSRKESLLNLAERYEGYGNSVRRVMEKRGDMPGILGVVADLIHTEKKYETALETALGGRIQNIVTDTEETARDMIQYLKENKMGRATFLPVSSVRGKESFSRPEACREKGALGVASELVTTDPRFQGVVNYLLGRTLVVDTIDHAMRIARKYSYSLNLVTLDGESFSPGGAMTGGSYRNTSNLLGRRREIQELEQKQKEMQRLLDQMRKKIQELERQKEECQREREEWQKRQHNLELDQNTWTLELAQMESQAEELKKGRSGWEEEKKKLEEQILRWTSDQQKQKEAWEELEKSLAEWESRAEEQEEELDQDRVLREQENRRLEKVRQTILANEQQCHFLDENSQRIQGEWEKLVQEAEIVEGSLSRDDDQVEERQSRIGEIQEEIRTEGEVCKKLEEKMAEESKRKESLSEQQRTSLEERENLTERLSALDKDAYRMQSLAERLEEQKTKLVDDIWNEYGLTPSEAEKMAEEGPDITLTEARRQVSRQKTAIRELGSVNVNAIEEYREVSGRYEFLKVQHEDLVKAADRLRSIIRDLETGMRRQFQEKFQQIQKEFDQVFRELFGGGKGRLELMDSDDILEAGIAINAQPPGKKLQNMMQLSGGEKALSAIALLFAIQNLKPSPFCLLDEIEAALDEPNVDRFALYLDRLKQRTQFIVITHRRGTMEMADRLYGITMQEKGVSALVSVDLTDPSLTEGAGE
ncbi:MAG: chromosome segregation protein SMC [Clostridiales bacterium]|nr:chromosome segregation protein SMC [Clostridiales bacterium]